MNLGTGSGDGRNYWGPAIVGGATSMVCIHGLAVQHHKEANRQFEVREKITQGILMAVHPEPKDNHTHQEEYSTELARGHIMGINTSGEAQFMVMQDFLAGKSTIEIGGISFICRN